VIAYGFVAFILGVRYLNVVDHRRIEEGVSLPEPATSAAD